MVLEVLAGAGKGVECECTRDKRGREHVVCFSFGSVCNAERFGLLDRELYTRRDKAIKTRVNTPPLFTPALVHTPPTLSVFTTSALSPPALHHHSRPVSTQHTPACPPPFPSAIIPSPCQDASTLQLFKLSTAVTSLQFLVDSV